MIILKMRTSENLTPYVKTHNKRIKFAHFRSLGRCCGAPYAGRSAGDTSHR